MTPQDLEALAGRIEKIAWDIPPPNRWTPELIELVVGIRSYTNRLAAQALRPAGGEDWGQAVRNTFDIGFAWRGQLIDQTIEDSRAVVRTIADGPDQLFEGLSISIDGIGGFNTADYAIVELKHRIKEALVAAAPRQPPSDEDVERAAFRFAKTLHESSPKDQEEIAGWADWGGNDIRDRCIKAMRAALSAINQETSK